MQKFKKIESLIMLVIFISIVPATVLAGSQQGSLKSKIQGKLSAPSNVQYEPYYLQTDNRQSNRSQGFQAQQLDNEVKQQAGGFQEQVYSPEFVDRSELGQPSSSTTPGRATYASYAIYNVKYFAELEENVITVKGEVVFEVFNKNGWTQLPLVSNS